MGKETSGGDVWMKKAFAILLLLLVTGCIGTEKPPTEKEVLNAIGAIQKCQYEMREFISQFFCLLSGIILLEFIPDLVDRLVM